MYTPPKNLWSGHSYLFCCLEWSQKCTQRLCKWVSLYVYSGFGMWPGNVIFLMVLYEILNKWKMMESAWIKEYLITKDKSFNQIVPHRNKTFQLTKMSMDKWLKSIYLLAYVQVIRINFCSNRYVRSYSTNFKFFFVHTTF